MFKFFRRLRYDYFRRNAFSRYFIYAIGEIILVVIGILIALQINNWNENKKHRVKEKEALLEILSDVETNSDGLKNILEAKGWNINHTINSIELILKTLEAKATYHDSMGVHFNNINRYEEFNSKTSGYESLSSSGMDLISDSNLRSMIGVYYTSSLSMPKIAYGDLRDDYYHYMLDYVRYDFVQKLFNTDNTFSLYPRNYAELLEKQDYLESLKIYLDVNYFYKVELENALKASKKLKKEITTYLKEH